MRQTYCTVPYGSTCACVVALVGSPKSPLGLVLCHHDGLCRSVQAYGVVASGTGRTGEDRGRPITPHMAADPIGLAGPWAAQEPRGQTPAFSVHSFLSVCFKMFGVPCSVSRALVFYI